MSKAGAYFDSVREKHVLVVGDVMLDKYEYAESRGNSPEGPHPNVHIINMPARLVAGGAGNSAMNLLSLGGRVTLCGVYGNDAFGAELEQVLYEKVRSSGGHFNINGMLRYTHRTTTKRRLVDVVHHQTFFRENYEDGEMSREDARRLAEQISFLGDAVDVVLVSDYRKGAINQQVMRAVYKLKKPVIVDPKPQNKGLYKHAMLIKPNMNEACAMTRMKKFKIEQVVERLRKYYANTDILISEGANGMRLCMRGAEPYYIPAVTSREDVVDVTGAGDTVTAVMALGIAAQLSLQDVTYIANLAASTVIRKMGTAPVVPQEVMDLEARLNAASTSS